MKSVGYFVLLFVFGLVGCSENKTSTLRGPVHLSADVTVHQLSAQEKSPFLSRKIQLDQNTSCEDRIAKMVCLSKNTQADFDRDCEFGHVPAGVIQKLQKIMEELPPVHRKVFCHLDRIQLHQNIFSIGYATQVQDEWGMPAGYMFGMREDVLNGSGKDYFSWKEQLNFGLSDPHDDKARVSPEGPTVQVEMNSANPTLLYVMTHELSHIVDMLNGADNIDYDKCQTSPVHNYWKDCPVPSTAFNSISWGPHMTVIDDSQDVDWNHAEMPDNKYFWSASHPLYAKFCFYFCGGKTLPPNDVQASYQELQNSTFLTSYSTSSPMEDFAEASALWALGDSGRDLGIVVKDKAGIALFDSRQQMLNPELQSKLKWLHEFYNRGNLKTDAAVN